LRRSTSRTSGGIRQEAGIKSSSTITSGPKRTIRDYLDYLRDSGLKAVTCNKVFSCFKAMLRFGEQRGYVAENGSPARRVTLPKSDSEVHDAFLTFERYELLKAKAGE